MQREQSGPSCQGPIGDRLYWGRSLFHSFCGAENTPLGSGRLAALERMVRRLLPL
jgi:hypothetical protein